MAACEGAEAPWLAPLSMETSNRSMSGSDELVVLQHVRAIL